MNRPRSGLGALLPEKETVLPKTEQFPTIAEAGEVLANVFPASGDEDPAYLSHLRQLATLTGAWEQSEAVHRQSLARVADLRERLRLAEADALRAQKEMLQAQEAIEAYLRR